MRGIRTTSLNVAAALMVLATPAWADSGNGAGAPAQGTQSELDALQDQSAVLALKAHIADLKAQIESDESKNSSSVSGSSPPPLSIPGLSLSPAGPGGMITPPAPTTAPAPRLPVIVGIQGRGLQLEATLRLSDGSETVATAGQPIGNGITVHAITSSGVTVLQAGLLVPLQFAGAVDQAPVTSGTPRVGGQ